MKARAAATPITLIVFAAATAAYAYFVDRHQISDADRAARPRDVFPSLRVDQVEQIELEHAGEVIVLVRQAHAAASPGPRWMLTSPRHESADTAAVDMLLREMEFATRVRQVSDGEKLAGAALAAPRARGSVRVGALEYRFVLGADAPRPEGAAYMKIDGEGTFVVDRSLKAQLLRGADAYRDRAVVAIAPNEIARVEVRAAHGEVLVLERRGGSVRVGGAMLRASRTAADRIFAALADARADSFLDEETARQATATAMRVSVAAGETGQPLELRLGGPCPGQPDEVALLRSSPSPMGACTARALVDALDVKQQSLLDASALWARADEVEQIRLETVGVSGPLVEIARKASGWHERAPEDRDLDPDESDSANGLAMALASARAVDPPAAGPDERLVVRTRATITRDAGHGSEVIELAAPAPDGTVLARRLEDGAILRFAREIARRFEPRPVALRPRDVWRTPPDPGSVVAVDDGCTPIPMRLELADGTWIMRTPRGFSTDPISVADLTKAILRAKAEAWVSESAEEGFGFEGHSACAVTLTLAQAPDEKEPRRVSLQFGRNTEGGVYARASGDSAVFIAPVLLRDSASHPPVDRSALRFDPDTVESITLVRGSSRLLLERKGDKLVRQGLDASDAGDDDKIEKALIDFLPQAAVHTGPPAPEEQLNHPTLEVIVKAAAPEGGVNAVRQTRIAIGAASQLDGIDVYFARASGVDATFAVPKRAVTAILDAW